MLRDLAWHATDTLTRSQLTMVQALGDELGLSADDRRRALDLTEREWQAWTDFLVDGSLPAEPLLPEMLRRLAEVAFTLSLPAERRGSAA
jgi:hypothetical protein